MCNEYAREIEMGRILKYFEEIKDVPPFDWVDGRIPNDLEPKASIKISDKAIVLGLEQTKLRGLSMAWSWKSPQGKPVFNFKSEGRDFAKSDRVLIPATAFYEYTAPSDKKIKLKDRHRFTMKGEEWFWIAGIVKENAFTMLTTAPGPDIEPYHDRQICLLKPEDGMHWLMLDKAEKALLTSSPKNTLAVKTVRKDGVERAA
jgi:putative SOS response-associated peptidase YedK